MLIDVEKNVDSASTEKLKRRLDGVVDALFNHVLPVSNPRIRHKSPLGVTALRRKLVSSMDDSKNHILKDFPPSILCDGAKEKRQSITQVTY
jgi:hypothetical protein